MERVRQVAGVRKLDQLPLPQAEKGGTLERPGYRIEKLELRPEEGIVLPALLFLPEREQSSSSRVVVYVHERGKETDAAPGAPIEQLVRGGARVLSVDLRGSNAHEITSPFFCPLTLSSPQWGESEWHEVKRFRCDFDLHDGCPPTAELASVEECSRPDRRIDPHFATTRLVRVERCFREHRPTETSSVVA